MPYPLNNVATADSYGSAATFTTQPTAAATVLVNNAAVYYTIQTLRQGLPGFGYTERYLPPGYWTFRETLDWNPGEQLVGILFRSAVAGTPAQVSAS